MKTEIHFSPKGNTVVGGYSAYRDLDSAIEQKHVPLPYGYVIAGEESDIRRLAEYVSLFGNCIRRLAGWRKACELAGVTIHAEAA